MTDYMKEAERLADAYAEAHADFILYGKSGDDGARAALLAHIQRGAVPEGYVAVPRFLAENHRNLTDVPRYQRILDDCLAPAPDQFRDAAKMMAEPAEVPSADQLWNNDEVMALNAELGLTMDQLSRLASAITRITHPAPPADWRERFSQAVYDDLAAADNQDVPLEEYPALILKVLDAVIGREMNPAPAGVPMPKPVAYGFGNTAITGHTNRLMMVRIDIPGGDQYAGAFWLPLVLADEAHTYGVACRAAGEAAGYVRGLRDAVRDADIEALRLYVRALCKAVDAATDFAGTVAGGASWWDDVWADHAAALDRARERISQAALRGEVKP